jgi:transcription-repair coupling factor (superfamily II helicase)
MDRDRPPGQDAKKRLKALEEFSHLGAGFAIAMKDLEIRGAGNLLGPEQSGHIAAVGYEMYCQLLRQAVDDARDQRPATHEVLEVDVDLRLQAYLPEAFLADPKGRLELLREMDDAIDDGRMAAIAGDLRDRFGKLPAPVVNLLRIFRLKHGLQAVGVRGVQWVEADRLVVRHPPDRPLGGAWLDAFVDVRPVEAGKTHLMLPPRRGRRGTRTGEEVLAFLLDCLSTGGEDPMMLGEGSPACSKTAKSRACPRR